MEAYIVPNMNNSIIIGDNIKVSIQSITQMLTYRGMYEGVPTKEINGSIIENIVQQARKLSSLNNFHLIEPDQKPIILNEAYAYGAPAMLPAVVCIAELHCSSVFKDQSNDSSALGLIWFQNDFMLDVDASISEKIKAVPFAKECEEFMF